MSHCVNCIHWDEEAADEDGRAPCAQTRTVPEVPRPITIWVRGDYSCPLFSQRVAIAPTHPPSVTE